jgi:hypothetical protein
MAETLQCDGLEGKCIFVKGHGGDHFAPDDGKDHSDDIRMRILRDSLTERDAEIVQLKGDLGASRSVAEEWRERAEREGRRAERAEGAIDRIVRAERQDCANIVHNMLNQYDIGYWTQAVRNAERAILARSDPLVTKGESGDR